MDKFQEMKVFAAVVDAGSFTGAARALDMPKAAVSRYVADLEERPGLRLLHRATRKLSPTTAGEIFNARSRQLLYNLDQAEAEITSRSGEASGLLKANVPVTFGLMHLAPMWPALLARGEPAQPRELAAHDVISYSLFASGENWTFTGPEGEVKVKVSPRMRTNSGDTCRAAALQHQGIILQPSFMVGADLAQGMLTSCPPTARSSWAPIPSIRRGNCWRRRSGC
jgi:DNA-binding transcriptional LysR family regulator